MQIVFEAMNSFLKELIPNEIKYVLTEKYETNETYEFIIIIEEKDLNTFKSKRFGNLLENIVNICNGENSVFLKKVVIDLEVLESYV